MIQNGVAFILESFRIVLDSSAGSDTENQEIANLNVKNRNSTGDLGFLDYRFDFSGGLGSLRVVLQPLWEPCVQFGRVWLGRFSMWSDDGKSRVLVSQNDSEPADIRLCRHCRIFLVKYGARTSSERHQRSPYSLVSDLGWLVSTLTPKTETRDL